MDGAAGSDDDEAVLRAFARVDGLVTSQFRTDPGALDKIADLNRLICLLDDLNQISATLCTARDSLKTQMDGAALGINATNAYGQTSRLGQKR